MSEIGLAVLILSCCVLTVLTEFPPELMEVIEHLHEECSETVGVDQALVKNLKNGEFPDDSKLKCYVNCMMVHLQVMSEEGELQVDLIEATMPEELKEHGAMDTLNKCKDTKGVDNCDNSFQLVKCFHTNNPELSAMFE